VGGGAVPSDRTGMIECWSLGWAESVCRSIVIERTIRWQARVLHKFIHFEINSAK